MDWAPHHVEVKYGVIMNNQGMTISQSEVIVLIITSSRAVRNSQGDPRIKNIGQLHYSGSLFLLVSIRQWKGAFASWGPRCAAKRSCHTTHLTQEVYWERREGKRQSRSGDMRERDRERDWEAECKQDRASLGVRDLLKGIHFVYNSMSVRQWWLSLL